MVATLNRLRSFGRSEGKVRLLCVTVLHRRTLSKCNQIARVLQQLALPPTDASLDYFVQQTKTEIWAEEKMEAAKREEIVKNPTDKSRVRAVS